MGDNDETLTGNNVSSVKNLSPFRYPGGKTWLIEIAKDWLDFYSYSDTLVEPFAGGASVSLAAVEGGHVDRAILVEKDKNVRDVWKAILRGRGNKLASQIRDFEFSPSALSKIINSEGGNQRERAFRTILLNRVRRNGILASSGGLLKNGEDGSGLESRWYPATIAKRIERISSMSESVNIEDYTTARYCLSEKYKDHDKKCFFVDPPYPTKGRRLYKHSDVDPNDVFEWVNNLSGEFLLTYEDSNRIERLIYEYGFEYRKVEMKNGHNKYKKEVLISEDFSWI